LTPTILFTAPSKPNRVTFMQEFKAVCLHILV